MCGGARSLSCAAVTPAHLRCRRTRWSRRGMRTCGRAGCAKSAPASRQKYVARKRVSAQDEVEKAQCLPALLSPAGGRERG